MNHDQPGENAGGADVRTDHGEEEPARLRSDLREAVRAQERLQVELRAAVSELSETLVRNDATACDRFDPEYLRLERRLRAVEQDLKLTTEQLQSILHSRIWRTLAAAGGLLLGFRRSTTRK
jgi:hypothetical protein